MLLIYRPRRDGRLSWPSWLTDSGRFTHKEVTRPAVSLAQDRESTPAEPAVLTTMLRRHASDTTAFCEILRGSKQWWTLASKISRGSGPSNPRRIDAYDWFFQPLSQSRPKLDLSTASSSNSKDNATRLTHSPNNFDCPYCSPLRLLTLRARRQHILQSSNRSLLVLRLVPFICD